MDPIPMQRCFLKNAAQVFSSKAGHFSKSWVGHRFALKISGGQCARDGCLTRKEINKVDDDSEFSKTRENQATIISPLT